jgi:hypothetical protein
LTINELTARETFDSLIPESFLRDIVRRYGATYESVRDQTEDLGRADRHQIVPQLRLLWSNLALQTAARAHGLPIQTVSRLNGDSHRLIVRSDGHRQLLVMHARTPSQGGSTRYAKFRDRYSSVGRVENSQLPLWREQCDYEPVMFIEGVAPVFAVVAHGPDYRISPGALGFLSIQFISVGGVGVYDSVDLLAMFPEELNSAGTEEVADDMGRFDAATGTEDEVEVDEA